MVEAFYEPAQRGNSEGFVFDDSEKDGGETALARQLAALLGWEYVWLFACFYFEKRTSTITCFYLK